jgi:hypothetical protein
MGMGFTGLWERVSPWPCRSTAERWTTLGGSTKADPAPSAGADYGEPTQTFAGRETVTRRARDDPASLPPHPPTRAVPPHPPAEAVPLHPPAGAVPPQPPAEIVRYGPGVPAGSSGGQAGPTAERVWRTGQTATPSRRPHRLRRLLGLALTVILLAASGLVLYLRFYHPPFHVTGVAISHQTRTACGVDLTGRISTNGAAGTVSDQWVLTSSPQPPQPQNASVNAGQHALYVLDTVEGVSRRGTASQRATLQVLGPGRPRSASTTVVIRCR